MKNLFVRLENKTTWPNPFGFNDVAYRLRYEQMHLTKSDMLAAASLISAYEQLFLYSQKELIKKVKMIKDSVNRAQSAEEI